MERRKNLRQCVSRCIAAGCGNQCVYTQQDHKDDSSLVHSDENHSW